MNFSESYTFVLEMTVRDYELDYQGIVNNANYLHYMEHTRHKFCASAGLTFAQMHERGIDPVLCHVEIDYFHPLRSDDRFFSCLKIARRGPRFIFIQDLYLADGTPVVKARITVACVENGRLTRGDVLFDAFSKYLTEV